MTIDDIIENFSYLEDWEDRYRYVIDLGRALQPLSAAAHNDANKVQGCASQVWLETIIEDPRPGHPPVLTFRADSDAHIVKGLVSIILAIYSGRTAEDILATDALEIFRRLALTAHLTAQRSNGVRSMVERIKRDARATLVMTHAAAAPHSEQIS